MGTCNHSHTKTPQWLAKSKLNRRTLMKATAAFTAAAAYSNAPSLAKPASAQGAPTQAQEWVQPDAVGGDGTLGFQSDFPFYAIAPHWPNESGLDVSIEVSTSRDGAVWSKPANLGPAHTDAGPADRDNRVFGNLAFTEESNYVRYRALNGNGEEQIVPGLTFTYIDATGGPGLGDISTASPIPSLERPPIISREEWGANLTYGGVERGGSEWLLSYQTVEHAIIHHSETSNFRDPLTEIRSIHYYHAITRGWGDIGYNYLVDFMGNVYEGRLGGDNVVGGHAYQYAYGSAGICVMGSFSIATATPEMLSGLTWITAWATRYLDPLARADFHETPNLPTICGHRDVNDSSCPGDSMYADLDYLREAVAEVHLGTRATIPNPAYSPGQVVAITADSANLRSLPGASQGIISSPGWGTVFQVIEGPATVDGEHWYHVRGDYGSGWLAQSTFGASDAAAPVGQFAHGDHLFVREDLVNLRDQPSLKGTIVGTVNFMMDAVVIDGPMPANGYTWYKVETAGGTGWITERHIAEEKDIAPPTRVIVGDSVITVEPAGVALRVNPSTDASQVVGLPEGTRGSVIEGPVIASGYAWVKVQTGLGTGWVAEEFLDPAPLSLEDVVKYDIGTTLVVDTDSLNLRSHPALGADVVESLGTGVLVEVIDGPEVADNHAWYQIDTGAVTGWCVAAFLAPTEAQSVERQFAHGDHVYVSSLAVNLRSEPGLSGDVIVVMVPAEGGTVLAGPEPADGHTWYQVESGGNVGWASAQYFGKGTADPAASSDFAIGSVVTTADGDAVNIRLQAGLNGEVVTQIFEGHFAEVVGGPVDIDGFSWVNVRMGDTTGWAVKQYLTVTETGTFLAGTNVRVIDGELNLREHGSLGAEVIAILPDATHAEVLSGPENADGIDWYRISTSRFGTGWASSEFLRNA